MLCIVGRRATSARVLMGPRLAFMSGSLPQTSGRIVLLMFAILAMDLKRAMAINVRRERHARDWSQEELADRARHQVTNDGSDRAQLANIASQAKEVLGVDELEAVADRGYY